MHVSPYEECLHQLRVMCSSNIDAAVAVASLRATLMCFEVLSKGMTASGQDDGFRPVHLVVVFHSCSQLADELLLLPASTSRPLLHRLFDFAISAAHNFLIEYRSVRQLVYKVAKDGAFLATDANRLIQVFDGCCSSSSRSNSDEARGGANSINGFLAHCGSSPARTTELKQVVAALLARGFATSSAALPHESILEAAEREARSMHSAAAGGLMFSSTVKSASVKSALRYADTSSRGDVIRWLDGSDSRFPACSALTQWLRGELMDAVRGACATAPARSHTGCGAAQKIEIEPHFSLPLAMLACYPGGGARFTRHVDNPPEAADLRVVTAILYLNGDWQPAHGGALRMYGVGSPAISTDADSSEPFVEVEPRRGTLAIFWSHLIPHEVLPASVARFAISLWMSVDASRQEPGWLDRPS